MAPSNVVLATLHSDRSLGERQGRHWACQPGHLRLVRIHHGKGSPNPAWAELASTIFGNRPFCKIPKEDGFCTRLTTLDRIIRVKPRPPSSSKQPTPEQHANERSVHIWKHGWRMLDVRRQTDRLDRPFPPTPQPNCKSRRGCFRHWHLGSSKVQPLKSFPALPLALRLRCRDDILKRHLGEAYRACGEATYDRLRPTPITIVQLPQLRVCGRGF